MTRHLSHNESLHIAGSFIDAGQLKAFNTATLPNSAWAYVDGIGEYYFDLNSGEAELIPDIITPDAGAPGRWKKKALSAISDFNIIKQTAASSGKLSLSGGTLTGPLTLHADPANALHAATKQYVDNLITGISWKDACKAATTANITLTGIQTVDDVSLTTGDRVLVKNQTVQTENGIYVVTSGAWNRAEDVNSNSELETATVLVEQGTANKNTQWTCTSTNVVIGTSNISFGQISGAGTYTAGAGLQLTGGEFKLDATYFADGSRAGLLSSSDWTKFNSAFVNGGNVFGTNASFGTNDAFSLIFKTGNVARMTIDAAGTVGIGSLFAASSGSTAFSSIGITPSYNQTGTANGAIRGIYYNPTVTSVIGVHYALEATSGILKLGDAANTTSSVTGSIQTAGGAYIAKDLMISGKYRITDGGTPKDVIEVPYSNAIRFAGQFQSIEYLSTMSDIIHYGNITYKVTSSHGPGMTVEKAIAWGGSIPTAALTVKGEFASSSSGIFRAVNVTPTINQSGTPTDYGTALDINPTLTSVCSNFYGLKISHPAAGISGTGIVWGLYIDSANSYFGGKVTWSGASVSNSATITGVHNLGGSAILTGTSAGATATVYNFTPGVTTNEATHQARAVVINPTFTNNVTPGYQKGNLALYVNGNQAIQGNLIIGSSATDYNSAGTNAYLMIPALNNKISLYISNNFNVGTAHKPSIFINSALDGTNKGSSIYTSANVSGGYNALAGGGFNYVTEAIGSGSNFGNYFGSTKNFGNASSTLTTGTNFHSTAYSQISGDGTMTVPAGAGFVSFGYFERVNTTTGIITFTNYYDFKVDNFQMNATGSGFTNRYGLYLNHTKGAGDTNVWGVYQTSNTVGNVFKGDTFIGDQTFSTLAGRHVYLAGTVRIRPAADGENKIELNGTGEYISSGSYLALSYGSNEFLKGTSTTVRLTPGNGTVTSGTKNAVEISNTWSQNAGTAVYNALSVNPAIIQTDAANGTVRGIYYNPSITSIIGTHYAWESTAGDILVTGGKVTWNGASVSNSATITGVHNLGGSAILTGATTNATAAVYNFTPNVTTNDATHQARAVVINPAFTNNVTPNYSRGNLALYVNGRAAIQTGLSIGTTNTNYNSTGKTAKLLISTTNTLEDPGIFISDDLDVNSGRALYSGRSFSNSTGTTAIFQASLINNSASTYGPITGTGFTYRGFSSGTNGAGGYYAQVGVTGTSSTVLSNSYMGFYSYGYYQSTSGVMTVPISTGFASGGQFQTSGGGTNVITNHYDFYTENFSNLSAGGFTNRYGLYLNHTKNAGDTNIWGVYQVSNTVNNFFAGPTTFGNSGTETKITMNGGSSGGGTASFMIGTGGLFTNNYFGFTYNGAAIYEIPSSSRFRFYNNVVLAGGGTSPFTIFGGGGGSTTTAGTAIRLGHGGIANGILTYISGTFSLLGIGGNNSSLTDQAFAPSSGNGSYNVILVDPIINQTGTANGTVRGIHYNPTVTSVLGSHYAFEASAGDIYLRAGGLRLMDSGYDRLAVSVQSAGILNIGGGGWNQVLIPTPFLTFTNANAVIQSSNSGNPLSILTPGGAGSAHNGVIIGRTGGGINATSGTGNALTIGSTTQDIFQPTSGTAVYNAISIVGRLNQTDTANGTVRGIYYNPAITSVLGTHYAFESASGDMLVGGTGKFMMNKSGTPSSAMEVNSSSLKVGSGFATTEVNNPVFKSVSLNISGSVTIDLSQGRVFYLTITGNVTSFSFTNEVQNAQYMFYFIKGTTNYTMAWAAGKFRFPFAAPIILTDPTVNGTTPAGSVDVLSAFCAVSGRLDIVLSPDLQNN